MKPVADAEESICALATVTLDAAALEGLGPRTMDRLADLVAERLAAREAAGQVPLLTAAEAARVGAGVHTDTVRRAIRSGALEVAGYVGQRPRLRRADVEAWVGSGSAPSTTSVRSSSGSPRPRARGGYSRVLGDALIAISQAGGAR